MYSKDKVRRCITLLNTPLAIFTGFGFGFGAVLGMNLYIVAMN